MPVQKVDQLQQGLMQLIFIITEDSKIITVTEVSPGTQLLLDEMVHRIQVQISKELAAQVADGDSPSTLQRCQQIIPLEIRQHPRLRITGVHHPIHQPPDLRILDLSPKERLQDPVVGRRKILQDIRLQ